MVESIMNTLAKNINLLKSKAFDLEMNWVSNKKPNLHPYVASTIRAELESLLKEIKKLNDRFAFILDKVKKNENGNGK